MERLCYGFYDEEPLTAEELEEARNDPNLLVFFNQMASKCHAYDRVNNKIDTSGDYEKQKVTEEYLRDMYVDQLGQAFTGRRFPRRVTINKNGNQNSKC